MYQMKFWLLSYNFTILLKIKMWLYHELLQKQKFKGQILIFTRFQIFKCESVWKQKVQIAFFSNHSIKLFKSHKIDMNWFLPVLTSLQIISKVFLKLTLQSVFFSYRISIGNHCLCHLYIEKITSYLFRQYNYFIMIWQKCPKLDCILFSHTWANFH